MRSSELVLSGAAVLEEVCFWSGAHLRSSLSLSSRALATSCKQNNKKQSEDCLLSQQSPKASTNSKRFLKSQTFHWVDSWLAQDTAPSLVHLGMACQERPLVLETQLPAAPQSGGALASSWPTPQWFENPSHLLHLGGTTGKLNCQSSKRKDESWSVA